VAASALEQCTRSRVGFCSAAASAFWLLVACDPNVVIGAVTRAEGGSGASASNGGASSIAGSGGASTIGGGGASMTAGSSNRALLFEARHEVDFSEWTSDGDDEGYLYCPDDLGVVTNTRAHSGSGSVAISIDTGGGATPICQMLRRTPAPSAYYGAWFFVEHDHEALDWWTIFFFKTKTTSHWDLGLYRDGYTSFGLYDHAHDESTTAPAMPRLPIARWFHLEAYLVYAADTPTELELWLDGSSMLRLTLDEAPPDLFWGLGNEAAGLSPSDSTLYIDDVTISLSRLGP
jgi:hypothetical protein